MSTATRRGFIGGTITLASLPMACRSEEAHHAKPRQSGTRHVLCPGPGWNGTAGSGGPPPAQSDVPLGTLVPDERFTGGFSAVPGQWVHGAGLRITALGLPPQDAGSQTINHFREAVFYLEGNSLTVTTWSVNETPVAMPDGTMAPQGSIGFSVEVGAGTGSVTAGDALLYCTLRGDHGLERQLVLPLVINVDGALDHARPTAWIDPVAGEDTAPGTRERPRRTLFHALSRQGVGDGGLVLLARAGAYRENRNDAPGVVPLANNRLIEVRPAPGLHPDQVIITWDDRLQPAPQWIAMARRTHFQGLTLDLSRIMMLEGRGKGWMMGFSGCRLIDPGGPNGPSDAHGYDIGYNLTAGPPNQRDGANSVFLNPNGGVFLTECRIENYVTLGARLYRNVEAFHSTDCFAGGSGYDDVVVDGYTATMQRSFHQRMHVETDLVIAAVEPAGPDQLRLRLAGSPRITTVGKRPDCKAQIVAGAMAGQDDIPVLAADTATATLTLPARPGLNLRPGDRLRYYLIWHSDFCQQLGVQRPTDRGMRNTTLFRYIASSPTSQLFLTQAAVALEPGTLISTQGRQFRLTGSAAANTVLPDDVLHLAGGARQGDYRLVASFDPASQTGSLLDPFAADQEATPVTRGKTIRDLAVALLRAAQMGPRL